MARPLARGCHWTPALPADDGTFTGRPMRGRRPGIKGGGPFPSRTPKLNEQGTICHLGRKLCAYLKAREPPFTLWSRDQRAQRSGSVYAGRRIQFQRWSICVRRLRHPNSASDGTDPRSNAP
ncbi:hypothetical protein N7468_007334 [Penicillium chermesinum]|uniref:Uncharacterized protein n=1 Tax=Penicillium chermesinum TaxID=63820 RepID=A0A9W9NU17_9EURO|nr:uncharacterized protein N7468_007334 [Penicillium chermesinum]KAJ5226109.1 hypothetical protein N7468_007334 [Penicillium chermesinum]